MFIIIITIILDSANDPDNHLTVMPTVDREIFASLHDRYNPYVHTFKHAS